MSNGAHDARSLDRPTCLSLLASVGVGRVGLSVDALPVIMPVGFRVDGDRIVFALPAGDRGAGAVNGTVVAFEADDVDPTTGVGWTVMVQGPARLVPDPQGHAGDRWGSPTGGGAASAPRDQRVGERVSEVVSVSTEVITGWLTDTEVRGTSTPETPSPV
jgi:nitroimidazol reductase NimA-like FMN-containing flavoprotein (pyridoxamine 5'-phosphate oxidase superfamily)